MAFEKFYTVEEYIASQAKEHHFLLHEVRQLILANFPMLEEKISYNCPFYYYKGMFCYLGVEKNKGVRVGFCRGKDLDNTKNLLDGADRQYIRLFRFKDLSEETIVNFVEIMHEALILQEFKAKAKQGVFSNKIKK
ncbi:MAG: DUF1801 domain-containing protein [Bacteroidota bacterium]